MNRSLLAPCLASFAFAAIAAAEFSAGAPETAMVMPRTSPRPVAPAALRTLDTARLGDTILARPLFSADRRPAAAAAGTTAAHAPPRLSAIMIGDRVKAVVFDDGGKPLVAREGGRAGPYIVTSIAPDRVVVLGAAGTQVLRPTPIPSGDDTTAQASSPPAATGLSLLQQLQRGQVPHYAVPPASSIQNLIARMRAQR